MPAGNRCNLCQPARRAAAPRLGRKRHRAARPPPHTRDMRLTETEQVGIAQTATAVLPAGSRVMLFGSRVDDTRRGGDVDLLVEMPAPCPPDEIVRLQSRFAVQLYRRCGERRIDIVVRARFARRPRRCRRSTARRHRVGQYMNRPGRLEAARWQIRRHADALSRAVADWDALPPQPWAVVELDCLAQRAQSPGARMPGAAELRWAALRDALATCHALLVCASTWLGKLPPGAPDLAAGHTVD